MKKYYFIHIRKVAGTSVRHFVARNFPKRNICPVLSQVELYGKKAKSEISDYIRQYDLVSGHYYDLPAFFDEKRFTFTFLRDPIARTISEINQIRNDRNDMLHEKAKGLSIDEMLFDPAFNNALENRQARYLVRNAGADYCGLSDEERLRVATRYLKDIDFFGLTESLALSLFMLAAKAGFTPPRKIPRVNTRITAKGSKIQDFLPSIGRLYELNKIDLDLHAFARATFEGRALEYLKRSSVKGF